VPRSAASLACPPPLRSAEAIGLLRRAPDLDAVAARIARLSVEEIESALAPRLRAPGTRGFDVLRRALSLLARWPSARLGEVLARFDARIDVVGISRAAGEVLEALGAELRRDGTCPGSGPVLIVANHPGAYDALATLGALGRDDVALIAADRPFLRALPRLGQHLLFVADAPEPTTSTRAPTKERTVLARARGLREALAWLERGGVLVQFGAGAIEPDARFSGRDDAVLGAWGDGTGLLADRALRRGAAIVPCFVSGVHSPRAKRLAIVRWAEQRGVSTIAPLVQATLPGFRDVVVAVRLGLPIHASDLRSAGSTRERTTIVRSAVLRLSGRCYGATQLLNAVPSGRR
jgi:hypothetical protein